MQNNENDFQKGINAALIYYFRAILRRSWIAFLGAAILTLAASYYIVRLPSIYKSTATLQIESDKIQPLEMVDPFTLDITQSNYKNTQIQIMYSDDILIDVIKDLKLDSKDAFTSENVGFAFLGDLKEFIKSIVSSESTSRTLAKNSLSSDKNLRNLIDILKSNLSIESVYGTNLITVSFESSDPELAKSVVDKISNTFVDFQIDNKMKITQKTVEWLKNRSLSIGDELSMAQQDLNNYIKENNIVDINSSDESLTTRSLSSANLSALNDQLSLLKSERLSLESQLDQIDAANTDSISELEVINKDDIFLRLRAQYIAAVSEQTVLSQRYGEKHPKLIDAKTLVKQLEADISSELQRRKSTIETNLKSLIANEVKIVNELNLAREGYISDSQQENEFVRLKEKVIRLKSISELLDTRFKEVDISSSFDSDLVTVIDSADLPIYPIKPKKTQLVLISYLLFTFLLLLIIATFVVLRNFYSNVEIVENDLNTKVIGKIPRLDENEDSKKLFKNGESHPLFGESIRSLRTNLLLSTINSDTVVTLVTSSVPNEGKSFSSLHLALSLSQVKNVLLVDGDLRKPSLSSCFDAPNYAPGFTEMISGTHSLTECIIKDSQSNLDFLPAGQNISNVHELISSNSFKETMDEIKKHYDIVIIDTAPVDLFSDTLAYTPFADNIIFVVKLLSTKKTTVRRTIEKIRNRFARLEGIIINNIPESDLDNNLKDYESYYSINDNRKEKR